MSQRAGKENSNSKHFERATGIIKKYKGPDGYIRYYLPEHPNCTKSGMIMAHRYIMEQHIGRLLSEVEKVHHINGIKDDNRIENLQIISGNNHQHHHNPRGVNHHNWKANAWNKRPNRERHQHYGRDKCPDCSQLKDKRANYCMKCSGKYGKKRGD